MNAILVSILIALVVALIGIRYKEVSQKRTKFDAEYSKFSDPLHHFLNAIHDNAVSLNNFLLTEFNNHKSVKEFFVKNLRGRRLKRFNQKWAEYEDEYNQVKDLGVTGPVVAIAPSLEALHGAGLDDAKKWETDRKQKIHSIIAELLKIAKAKIWL